MISNEFFVNILNFIDLNKYLLLLIIMFLEGPIIGFFAGFSASLDYFNLWLVLFIAIIGKTLPDTLLYFVGRMLHRPSVKGAFSFFGLHKGRINWMKKNLNKHSIKTISFIKLVPPLPVPGLILAGFLKIDFKKFFIISLVFNVISGIFFVFLGYFSGVAVNTITKYLRLGQFIVPIALILAVFVYWLIKIISDKFSKEVKK